MNNFNRILHGKGWILTGFSLLLSAFPLYWYLSGQVIHPASLYSILGVMVLFFLLGTYELFTFYKGKERSFLIKKKRHYSSPRFVTFTCKDSISMELMLNKTMLYRTKKINHINKLFGFSSGIHHSRHSARFGWKPTDDGKKVEIWAYVRNKGMKSAKLISALYPSKRLHLSITDHGFEYVFTVVSGDYRNTIEIDCEYRKPWFRYLLWPYFGGESKSPRNTIFKLKRL